MRRFRAPYIITASYLAVGALYIAFSDRFVATVATDARSLSDLQTYKGWGFILVTGLLLFAALRVHDARQRRTMQALREARDEARRSVDQKNALLRELHHRVKNNLQLILSMLRLGTAYHSEDSGDVLMESLYGRIFAVALVHEHVYHSARTDCLQVGPLVEELCRYLAQLDTTRRINISFDSDDVAVSLDEAVPIGVILQEAVRNSIEHAFPHAKEDAEPTVRVSARRGPQDQCVIEVADNGVGFDRERTALRLGTAIMEATAAQVNGELDVSSDRTGTTVRLATAGSSA